MNITVSNRTVIKVLALTIGFLMGLKLLSMIGHILTLIAVAFFLALALNPAVSWISKRLKNRSRVLATGIAYIIVISILTVFIAFVFPPLVTQTADFVGDLPRIISDLKTQDSAIGRSVRQYDLDRQIDDISSQFGQQLPQLRGQIFSTATRIGSTIVSLITVLILTFMMLVEGPEWLKKYWAIHPASRRAHDKAIARRMYRIVTGYVNGQLIIALIGASFAVIALFMASTILNVRDINPIALGGIVAITGLIPMIGNTLGAVIVVFVALLASVPLAIVMAVFFLIYQQIENTTIQPYIQARQNELTPLLVFIAALVGVGVAGLLGALIAIPAAGCIKVLVEDYFATRKSESAA